MALYAVSYSVVAVGIAIYMEHVSPIAHPQSVRGVTPDSFPILVISTQDDGKSWRATIVYQFAIRDFLRDIPQYTFMVPQGFEAKLNEQLTKLRDGDYDSFRYSSGTFEVERMSDGTQAIKVDATGDSDVNVGWYTANQSSYTPKHYQHYRDRVFTMKGMLYGLIVNPAIWLAVYALRRNLRRSSSRIT
jgi:hypothetical protein